MKIYQEDNVFEATMKRIKFAFENFDNVYVSFSGGKDSGLLLNMVLEYKRKNNITKKIGVFHQDFEAQYQLTTDYVTKMFEENLDDIEPYWVCLPMGSRCAVSNFQMYWYPWDEEMKEAWVRPMPKMPYVINLQNNPGTYDLEDNNCTDATIAAGAAVGVQVPDTQGSWPTGRGSNPGDLGEDLRLLNGSGN